MFVGTGSDVGKSVINAGFCRIFLQDGYTPAPFKSQNMSLNSYATVDNLEIGRAQAVQAEACGINCSTDMNPILLKPVSNHTSQLVLHGKPFGNKSAMEYFNKTNRSELFVEVKEAFNRLKSSYSPIVMEGAGSISEVNLWDKDIVNMSMAEYADAAVYLIADIDKGGVIASVYGSILLLPAHQRKLIKGIIINKFRGDVRLFEDGKKIIKDLTGVPVVGVIPYFRDIFIEQEDSVVLDNITSEHKNESINIAVVLLKSMSNFTDFNMLERTHGVNLIYTANPSKLSEADIIIIPGSKNTISDMQFIREMGLHKSILNHYKNGKPVYGICGGYQMMGEMIFDPLKIEGDNEAMPGLGMLPITTTIEKGKVTRQCTFKMINSEITGEGYEIHSGATISKSPLCVMDNGIEDGYYLNDKCWGSYIHGIFDNKDVIEYILKQVSNREHKVEDYKSFKERNYNLLADKIRECIDMDYIYKTLE